MITALLNRLLVDNPTLNKRLISFQGKTIALVIGRSFAWQITEQGQLLASENQADAVMYFNLLSLPLWWLNRPAFQRAVHIEGDQKLALAFAEVLLSLRWDIEAALSDTLGDVAAYRLVRWGKGAFSWSSLQISGLLESLAEYYQYETGAIVERRQLDRFYQHVDTLRADTDRLEKRLQFFMHELGG